jgi:hypothetical protein
MLSDSFKIEAPLAPPMERRRFNRLRVPLGVEYQTHLPETGELCQGQGVLRDISLCGSYFHTDQCLNFAPGQILSLTIAASLPYIDLCNTSHLKARAEVVRVDPPGVSGPSYGVALNFVEGLSFSSP